MNDKTGDKSDQTSERTGPDMMTAEELVAQGGEQYAYRDQTRTVADLPLGAQGDGLSSAVLNPAYYPASVKPEALHTEAEKKGAEYPEGPVPDKTAADTTAADKTVPDKPAPKTGHQVEHQTAHQAARPVTK